MACSAFRRAGIGHKKLIHSFKIDVKAFQTHFCINYCSTVHKSQGDTISKDYTIYDWEHLRTCGNVRGEFGEGGGERRVCLGQLLQILFPLVQHPGGGRIVSLAEDGAILQMVKMVPR